MSKRKKGKNSIPTKEVVFDGQTAFSADTQKPLLDRLRTLYTGPESTRPAADAFGRRDATAKEIKDVIRPHGKER